MMSCKKDKTVRFCMGVTPKGKPIKCGKKFYSGDLTLYIERDKAFGVSKIYIEKYEYHNSNYRKINKRSLKVSPELKTANTNISLYNSGKFKFKALIGDKSIGESVITVVE